MCWVTIHLVRKTIEYHFISSSAKEAFVNVSKLLAWFTAVDDLTCPWAEDLTYVVSFVLFNSGFGLQILLILQTSFLLSSLFVQGVNSQIYCVHFHPVSLLIALPIYVKLVRLQECYFGPYLFKFSQDGLIISDV